MKSALTLGCWVLSLSLILFLWLSSLDLVDTAFIRWSWLPASDKFLHFTAFLVLSTASTTALLLIPSLHTLTAAFLSIGLCLSISASNEVLQMSSPFRDSLSLADMAADAMGYIAGALATCVLPILRSRRQRTLQS